MTYSRIVGMGRYLPERVMTNFDLEKIVDTSDEWIRTRTGVERRHVVEEDQTTSDMCVESAKSAMEDAARLDEEFAKSGPVGPLHGVPVAVKALCDIAEVRSAAGTTILDDHVPETDATVVHRLEEAGAVLVGSLTMTEGASAVHHPSIEPPRNPWDPAAWAGASSSGSGVATAAGLCFASLGSDTAGSIRAPSHFNGVVGLKPTYGRVSRTGVFPLSATLDHVGPMTRTVADCAAMLGVLAGADPRDPSCRQVPVPDLLDQLENACPGSVFVLARMRVAMVVKLEWATSCRPAPPSTPRSP